MKSRQILALILLILTIVFLAGLARSIPGYREFVNAPSTKLAFNLMPVALIIGMALHGLFAGVVRREGILGERQAERVRTLERRLLFWSFIAALATCALALLFPEEKIFAYSFWMYMLIVFLIYEPLLNAKKPARKSPWAFPERARAASLQHRPAKGLVPVRAWLLLWGIWCFVAIVAAIDLAHVFRLNPFKWSRMENAFVCLSVSGGALILWPLFLRWWIRGPEPMIEGGLEELKHKYEELRHFKSWASYVGAAGIAIPFLLFLFADATGGWEWAVLPVLLFGPALVLAPIFATFQWRRKEISGLLRQTEHPKSEVPNRPNASAKSTL